MECVGRKIVSCIEEKSNRNEDVNFSFFANEGLLSLLLPSLCLYYLSRAGQLEARHCVVRHMTPYLFTTRKTNYMQSAIWEMGLEFTAPSETLEQLGAPGGSCTNISGLNDFGNVEDDEANEMTGVRETKMGAATGTFNSLKLSFNSSHVLSKGKRKL